MLQVLHNRSSGDRVNPRRNGALAKSFIGLIKRSVHVTLKAGRKSIETMMKIFSTGLLCLSAAVAFAQSTEKAPTGKPERGAMFAKMDLDSDGRISRDEASKSDRKRLQEKFDTIDANKDGFLDKPELIAFRKEMRARRGKSE
jgi:Ca2+-binding EF-hand superfamily protein